MEFLPRKIQSVVAMRVISINLLYKMCIIDQVCSHYKSNLPGFALYMLGATFGCEEGVIILPL